MSSHAMIPLLDTVQQTTESRTILTDILSTQMQFHGIRLSDAMWMGDYGSMNNTELMSVYVHSFLAGMDMLMIPGAKFALAVTTFRDLYDNTTPEMQKLAIMERTGLSWQQVQTQFQIRLQESLSRIAASQSVAGHAVDTQDASGTSPNAYTTDLSRRYEQIFNSLRLR
jgi:beta-glucosidase-like glycosyl hydrolase